MLIGLLFAFVKWFWTPYSVFQLLNVHLSKSKFYQLRFWCIYC